ncbi:hypothetical protein PPYR_03681 [Photinus pyralis]|uniref:Protein sleepless n=1 Tax=Photinus pyralis TaxID=7054 RepID=A0A5N4A3K2_PHOPY|nr:uncharacterized protein LOC116161077 [Photinus pyralis]KAB0791881.1 hypothetical protein PPYR_03681 [Photinus pyralis]
MYIKTLLATLFLVHAVNAALKCYTCDSTKGHTNCQSGSGVSSVECGMAPPVISKACLQYSETVDGSTKYVRECSGRKNNVSPCQRMRDQGRKLPSCSDCDKSNCNGTPL